MAQLTGLSRRRLVAAVLSAAGAAALAPAAGGAPLGAVAPATGAVPGRRRLDSTPLVADPSSTARNIVRAPNPQVVPLSVRGAPTQSVALQTWESSTGDPVALIAGDGGFYTDSSLHIRGSTRNGESARQPLMILSSDGTQKWSLGLDSSDRPANDGFFLGRVNGSTVIDVLFVKSYSPTQHAVGINLVPPPRAGLAVSGWDNSTDAPSLLLRVGVRQLGEAIRVVDSGGFTRAAIRSDGSIVTPRLRVTTPFPPRERTSPGERGDIAWDSGYVYVCIAKDRWRRARLSDW